MQLLYQDPNGTSQTCDLDWKGAPDDINGWLIYGASMEKNLLTVRVCWGFER